MKPGKINNDPAFPVMAMDIMSNVLSRADHPANVGTYLTEEIRDLTGARCVLLIQCLGAATVTAHRVVSVNPLRRREWAESPVVNRLYDVVHRMPAARFWRGDEPSEVAGLLRREGFELSMAFPLNAGAFSVGAMLVLGLPDEEHISSVLSLLNDLSTIVALVLRNSFLFECQEEIIVERTAEWRNSNKQLQIELAERKEAERSIALLSFALNNVHEAAFLIDESARFRYVNEESCRALEYTCEELLGLGVADVDPDFPMERWAGHWDELKTRGSLTFEGRHKAKDGSISPVEIYSNYFEYGGEGYNLALARDITERKQVEDTLRFIAQRGWAGNADSFLTALAGYLGDTLGMDYVLIAQLADDDHGMAETSALYAKGEILPNMRYELKGTPCDNVIGKNLCLYPEGVQALFPADTLLADMGAESYAGIPLWDSAGRPIGLLAVLDGRPFHDEGMISYILQLAAASAAAVLERERHDRLLMAREREFRTLAENSPDYILRYDNGCRCIYANPRIENTLGIPAGGMPGKTPMEIFPGGEYREYQDRIEEVLRTGADADLEVVVPDTGEGVQYHHIRFTAERNQEGAITGVLVIGSDITTRKEAGEEIRRLKNYLANIIDSMPSVLVGMNRDEIVTQWNRQAEEISGISATEAVGRPITELLPDFSPWIASMRGEIDQQRPASMEKLLIEKGGERRFYDLMLYPIIANGAEGAVVRIEDATERARVQELMIQTEKMILVGGLAAGMAHEINNPLGIITQAAQNIERRVSPELPANRKAAEELGVSLEGINAYFQKRQIPEFIGSIRTAGFRAAKIVANMLQFSRYSGTTMQPVSPAGIIEQSLELAASDYDLKKKFDFRSIEIIRDYAPDMPEVPMVVVEMEQVMLNLLKNAAQAMTLNPPDRRPKITLRLRREERYTLIEVEDNGPGMEEEVWRRVFEPFFTTKEPGMGTGLGLSVSYMIITQNHKGLMEVVSKPGKGACFRVRLPLSKESIYE